MTTTEIETFQFPATGATVRTVVVKGVPLFVARDVAEILGYSNPQKAVRDHVPIAHRGVNDSFTPDLDPQTVLLSEAGLYRLIMRSRTAGAEAFQEWVTAEVLPAIRKTGRYEVTPAAEMDELEVARRYVLALEAKRELEAKVAALAPSAAAWDHLASGDGDWSVSDAAKILSRDPAIVTGRDRLFDQLAAWGWVFRAPGDGRWRAMQTQVDLGRVSEMPQSHYHPVTGELVLDPPQVRIKPKGLVEIHRRLGGTAPLDSPAGPRDDTPVSHPGRPGLTA